MSGGGRVAHYQLRARGVLSMLGLIPELSGPWRVVPLSCTRWGLLLLISEPLIGNVCPPKIKQTKTKFEQIRHITHYWVSHRNQRS